jgi:hypothetical protein
VGANSAGYPDDLGAMDSREVAMLPNYCIYTYSFRDAGVPGSTNEAEVARWTQIIGPMFRHLHHYCLGIMKTNRALIIATDPTAKRSYLSSAIGEFDYVINRSPADFVLLPEILMKKGENLIRLGKDREGVATLEQSIQLKPDYAPPYGILSDYYKSKGNGAKALEVAKRGLTAVPDAKGLKMRVDVIEGAGNRKR